MGVEVTVTPSKAKKIIWILVILILLGGGAFAVWKFGVLDSLFKKTAPPAVTTPTTTTPTENTPSEPGTTETEPGTPIEEAPQEPLPEVAGDGTIALEIGNVEFESKTLKAKDNSTTTRYKVGSVTISVTNHQADAITLKGEMVVLDSKGNNAVSNNFIYKTFEIGDVGAGATYNRKLPVNTVGEPRPFLTGIKAGDQLTIQISLIDTNAKVVRTAKKSAVVA